MSLVPVLQRLEALDDTALGAGGIALATLDVRELQRFLDGVQVRLAGDLAVSGEPVADRLRDLGESSAQAAAVERAAQTIAVDPRPRRRALPERRVGLEHVNAYRRIALTLSPDQQTRLAGRVADLLDQSWSTPEQFGRRVAAVARGLRTDDGEHAAAQRRNDRGARWGYRADGMGWLRGIWDPETAARMFAMLTAETDHVVDDDPTLSREQAGADALANLVLNAGRVMHHGITEVVVLIDLQTLLEGARAGGVSYLSNGTHLPVSTIRRLCCDARIIPMILNGDGQPLDVGRDARLANRAQRRALRKLYRTCAHPGCEVRFDDCQIHHVDWWEHLGPTDLANLLPVCSRHHHLIHEGGWRLTIDAHRTINLHRPDGSHFRTMCWEPPAGEQPEFTHRHRRRRPPDREPVAA